MHVDASVCVFSSKFTCFHDLPGLPKVASSFVAGQSVQCVQSSHTHPEVSASASRKPPLPGGDQDMLQGTGLVCSTWRGTTYKTTFHDVPRSAERSERDYAWINMESTWNQHRDCANNLWHNALTTLTVELESPQGPIPPSHMLCQRQVRAMSLQTFPLGLQVSLEFQEGTREASWSIMKHLDGVPLYLVDIAPKTKGQGTRDSCLGLNQLVDGFAERWTGMDQVTNQTYTM